MASGLSLVGVAFACSLIGLCAAQVKRDCLTPQGKSGVCADLKLCPYLLEKLLKNRTAESDQYLRNSICEKPHGTNVFVCCDRPSCVTDDGVAGSCVEPAVCSARQALATRGSCRGAAQVCCSRKSLDGYVSRETGLPDFGFCGLPDSLILKPTNKTTLRHQHPWTALLVYRAGARETEMCGGVLVAPRFVVTAAHCIDDKLVKVRLGVHNLTQRCGDIQSGCPLEVGVSSKVIAPTFNNHTLKDDIALVILSTAVPHTKHIRPICLPEHRMLDEVSRYPQFLTAGWGVNRELTGADIRGDTLQSWGNLPLRSARVCRGAMAVWAKMLAPFLTIDVSLPANSICAGGTFGEELCAQDSGGGLVWSPANSGPRVLLGVHSKSVAGCKAPVPAVYTAVLPHLDWITKTMADYYHIKNHT